MMTLPRFQRCVSMTLSAFINIVVINIVVITSASAADLTRLVNEKTVHQESPNNQASLNHQASTNRQAPLTVELIGIGKTLQYSQAARLSDVATLAQQQGLALQYSIAVTLFDNNEEALQKSLALKNSVLNQMVQHNLVAHPLFSFIQQSQFAPRLLSGVDIDQVRLDKFDNPLLNGQIALSAPSRENKVRYIGHLERIDILPKKPGIPLYQHIKIHQQPKTHQTSKTRFNLMNAEYIPSPILIYPNGEVRSPDNGNWLTTQFYLPPLTTVYIPFDEVEHSQLDQDIIKLLTQRKPNSSKNSQ